MQLYAIMKTNTVTPILPTSDPFLQLQVLIFLPKQNVSYLKISKYQVAWEEICMVHKTITLLKVQPGKVWATCIPQKNKNFISK